MREREIWIRLLKKQIVNDVAVQCNLIGRSLQKSEDTEETKKDKTAQYESACKEAIKKAKNEDVIAILKEVSKLPGLSDFLSIA